jgi:hypothetical protein
VAAAGRFNVRAGSANRPVITKTDDAQETANKR